MSNELVKELRDRQARSRECQGAIAALDAVLERMEAKHE